MRTTKLTAVFIEQVRSAPENLFICFIITLSLKTSLPHFLIGRDLDKAHVCFIEYFPPGLRANESLWSTCGEHVRRDSDGALHGLGDCCACVRPFTMEAGSKWNSLKFDSNILFLLRAQNSCEMKHLVLFRAGRDYLKVSPWGWRGWGEACSGSVHWGRACYSYIRFPIVTVRQTCSHALMTVTIP